MTRSLRVSRAVAARLSVTAHRQLARPHGHPHLAAYQCPVCLRPGVPADDETSVIVWSSAPMDLVRLAHGECTRSMIIETGRGVGYWVEPTNTPGMWASGGARNDDRAAFGGETSSHRLWPPGLQDLLTIDAFGVVHGGQPVVLAGPTQEGALLTTKTLAHRVTVLSAIRGELEFGLIDDRAAAPPESGSRLAFHDEIIVVASPPIQGQPAAEVLAGTLHTSQEWTAPEASADMLIGYFELDALDDPAQAVATAFDRGPVIGGRCRIDRR